MFPERARGRDEVPDQVGLQRPAPAWLVMEHLGMEGGPGQMHTQAHGLGRYFRIISP